MSGQFTDIDRQTREKRTVWGWITELNTKWSMPIISAPKHLVLD